jgi:hypothetical protein
MIVLHLLYKKIPVGVVCSTTTYNLRLTPILNTNRLPSEPLILQQQQQAIMRWASDNEEATSATIGCVHDRSDDDYSEKETDREADNLESARKIDRDMQYMANVHRENSEYEKAKAQRAANVKHEEAKKSEFRLKMLSKLLNEKDEAEAYISCMVLAFLLT